MWSPVEQRQLKYTPFEPIPHALCPNLDSDGTLFAPLRGQPDLCVYPAGASKQQGERNSSSEHQDGNVDIALHSVRRLPLS